MSPKLTKIVKEFLFNSPLRKYYFPKYEYIFTVPQLCFLCQCIEDTRYVEGAIAEVGCSNGNTAVFLNKYMDAQKIEKNYYALDTFSGFVSEDIDMEVLNRGKTPDLFAACFQANKKKWFDGTMQQNNIYRVRSIETDINTYDLTKLGYLSFVLLDLDLYRPMKKALPELYKVLRPEGIIVVDDCDSENIRWDGSYKAYKEFMIENDLPLQIIYSRFGIIKKDVKIV